MRRQLNRFLGTLAIALCLATSVAAGLRDDIDRLLRLAPMKGARVAVSVRDADSGTSLAAVNASEPMIPASNMKLLTSGAALHVLGADFEFTTRLLRAGDNLVVVGSGDPGLGDPALLAQMNAPGGGSMDVEALLRIWTSAVAQAGVASIDEVVVDDRVFDREFVHHAWPADQLNADYCAQVAGLNFHANVLHFFPRPRPGQPPDLSDVRPRAEWLKIANNATSNTTGKAEHSAWIARKLGTNEMSFRGNVRYKSAVPTDVTVHDMPDFFARLLADRLRGAGIKVSAHRVSRKDDPPSEGAGIGPLIVTPLRTILARCNQDSENLYAEALLKRIGHDLTGQSGSWSNGGAILRHVVLERLSDPALGSGFVVSDGSGLSRENRITAALMTAWLNSFSNDSQLGPTFLESLAVGSESGTLRKRYQSVDLGGATIQAKTGYINGVSCLSGFVTSPEGRRRSFSILVNGFAPGGVTQAKKLQDQIVTAIARDMAEAGVALGGE